MAFEDRDLHDRLRKVGFALDDGEDDTGFFMKLLRRLSGYYLNVGASDLIADGRIKLKPGVEIDRLEGAEAVFPDGSRLDVDLLVLATGWKPLLTGAESFNGQSAKASDYFASDLARNSFGVQLVSRLKNLLKCVAS